MLFQSRVCIRTASLLPSTLLLLLLMVYGMCASAWGMDWLESCSPHEIDTYLALAEASELVYDDSQPGLTSTPSGCVALVKEDARGNLIIAFRGSMLGDRNPKHPFSSFGGANMKRNYRDWVATNLKQTAGFLPRQYTEAATLVEELLAKHPLDKKVYVTGHSKGGGAAAYAFIAAFISPNVETEALDRMRAVTFNAAVVREQNWRRLFRSVPGKRGNLSAEPPANCIDALFMQDDPVSKIASAEERKYIRRICIVPTTAIAPTAQHGIGTVISEMKKQRNKTRQMSRRR